MFKEALQRELDHERERKKREAEERDRELAERFGGHAHHERAGDAIDEGEAEVARVAPGKRARVAASAASGATRSVIGAARRAGGELPAPGKRTLTMLAEERESRELEAEVGEAEGRGGELEGRGRRRVRRAAGQAAEVADGAIDQAEDGVEQAGERAGRKGRRAARRAEGRLGHLVDRGRRVELEAEERARRAARRGAEVAELRDHRRELDTLRASGGQVLNAGERARAAAEQRAGAGVAEVDHRARRLEERAARATALRDHRGEMDQRVRAAAAGAERVQRQLSQHGGAIAEFARGLTSVSAELVARARQSPAARGDRRGAIGEAERTGEVLKAGARGTSLVGDAAGAGLVAGAAGKAVPDAKGKVDAGDAKGKTAVQDAKGKAKADAKKKADQKSADAKKKTDAKGKGKGDGKDDKHKAKGKDHGKGKHKGKGEDHGKGKHKAKGKDEGKSQGKHKAKSKPANAPSERKTGHGAGQGGGVPAGLAGGAAGAAAAAPAPTTPRSGPRAPGTTGAAGAPPAIEPSTPPLSRSGPTIAAMSRGGESEAVSLPAVASKPRAPIDPNQPIRQPSFSITGKAGPQTLPPMPGESGAASAGAGGAGAAAGPAAAAGPVAAGAAVASDARGAAAAGAAQTGSAVRGAHAAGARTSSAAAAGGAGFVASGAVQAGQARVAAAQTTGAAAPGVIKAPDVGNVEKVAGESSAAVAAGGGGGGGGGGGAPAAGGSGHPGASAVSPAVKGAPVPPAKPVAAVPTGGGGGGGGAPAKTSGQLGPPPTPPPVPAASGGGESVSVPNVSDHVSLDGDRSAATSSLNAEVATKSVVPQQANQAVSSQVKPLGPEMTRTFTTATTGPHTSAMSSHHAQSAQTAASGQAELSGERQSQAAHAQATQASAAADYAQKAGAPPPAILASGSPAAMAPVGAQAEAHMAPLAQPVNQPFTPSAGVEGMSGAAAGMGASIAGRQPDLSRAAELDNLPPYPAIDNTAVEASRAQVATVAGAGKQAIAATKMPTVTMSGGGGGGGGGAGAMGGAVGGAMAGGGPASEAAPAHAGPATAGGDSGAAASGDRHAPATDPAAGHGRLEADRQRGIAAIEAAVTSQGNAQAPGQMEAAAAPVKAQLADHITSNAESANLDLAQAQATQQATYGQVVSTPPPVTGAQATAEAQAAWQPHVGEAEAAAATMTAGIAAAHTTAEGQHTAAVAQRNTQVQAAYTNFQGQVTQANAGYQAQYASAHSTYDGQHQAALSQLQAQDQQAAAQAQQRTAQAHSQAQAQDQQQQAQLQSQSAAADQSYQAQTQQAHAQSEAHQQQLNAKMDSDIQNKNNELDTKTQQLQDKGQQEVDQHLQQGEQNYQGEIDKGNQQAAAEKARAEQEAAAKRAEAESKKDDGGGGIGGLFHKVAHAVSSAFNALMDLAKSIIAKAAALCQQILEKARQLAMAALEAARKLALAALEAAKNAIQAVIHAVASAIRSIISAVASAIRAVIQALASVLEALVATLTNILASLVQAFQAALNAILDGLIAAVGLINKDWARALDNATRGFRDAVNHALDGLQNNIRAAGAALEQRIQAGADTLKNGVSAAENYLNEKVTQVEQQLHNAVEAAYQVGAAAINTAFDMAETAVNAVFDVAEAAVHAYFAAQMALLDAAESAVHFIANKAVEALDAAMDAVGNMIQAAVSLIPDSWKKAFIDFWNGPWREMIIIGLVSIAAVALTVATGGVAGILLAGVVGGMLAGGTYFGGEMIARESELQMEKEGNGIYISGQGNVKPQVDPRTGQAFLPFKLPNGQTIPITLGPDGQPILPPGVDPNSVDLSQVQWALSNFHVGADGNVTARDQSEIFGHAAMEGAKGFAEGFIASAGAAMGGAGASSLAGNIGERFAMNAVSRTVLQASFEAGSNVVTGALQPAAGTFVDTLDEGGSLSDAMHKSMATAEAGFTSPEALGAAILLPGVTRGQARFLDPILESGAKGPLVRAVGDVAIETVSQTAGSAGGATAFTFVGGLISGKSPEEAWSEAAKAGGSQLTWQTIANNALMSTAGGISEHAGRGDLLHGTPEGEQWYGTPGGEHEPAPRSTDPNDPGGKPVGFDEPTTSSTPHDPGTHASGFDEPTTASTPHDPGSHSAGFDAPVGGTHEPTHTTEPTALNEPPNLHELEPPTRTETTQTTQAQDPRPVVDQLLDRGVPYSDPNEFPGLSGGIISGGLEGSYLRTMDIQPSELPYPSSIRENHFDPTELPTSLSDVPVADVHRKTDTYLASDEHSGSAGVVALGELSDGRPVAIKTYYPSSDMPPEQFANMMLEEARSAKLLSDMGVGPEFHGLQRDADGRWSIVTDVVPGDFGGTEVNPQSLHDLDTILGRMNDAGIQNLGDFQMYRTQDGRLQVIDPGGIASSLDRPARVDPNSQYGDYTSQRVSLLSEAPPEVGRQYLDQLRTSDPEAYAGLTERMKDSGQPWADQYRDHFPPDEGSTGVPGTPFDTPPPAGGGHEAGTPYDTPPAGEQQQQGTPYEHQQNGDHEPTQEPVPESKPQELEPAGPDEPEGALAAPPRRVTDPGNEVRVMRSNGELEEGWTVVSRGEDGTVVVGKGNATKRVPETELLGLNALQHGSEVNVLRSSGQVEGGWQVVATGDNGMVRVSNGTSIKDIPAEQLLMLNRLEPGAQITVQRSNGAIEGGWEIVGIDPATGRVRVTKDGAVKNVPLSDAMSLNRESLLKGNVSDARTDTPAFARGEGGAQGQEFARRNRIEGGVPVVDGYVDGGRGMRVGPDGRVQSGREAIVVDRARDANLATHLEYARSLRNMPPEERALALAQYVDALMSPSEGRNFSDQAVNRWEQNARSNEVLLGDVPGLGGGVCRHRSLLYKVLGDEAGLNVALVRGNLRVNGPQGPFLGAHAWNEVTVGGRSVVVDVMNPPHDWNFPELSQTGGAYHDAQGQQLYNDTNTTQAGLPHDPFQNEGAQEHVPGEGGGTQEPGARGPQENTARTLEEGGAATGNEPQVSPELRAALDKHPDPLSDKRVNQFVGSLSPEGRASLDRLARLEHEGRVEGVSDWFADTSRKTRKLQGDELQRRVADSEAELRAASSLADQDPNAVVLVGGDNRNSGGNHPRKKPTTFDLRVVGPEGMRDVEVSRLRDPVSSADIIAGKAAHADKQSEGYSSRESWIEVDVAPEAPPSMLDDVTGQLPTDRNLDRVTVADRDGTPIATYEWDGTSWKRTDEPGGARGPGGIPPRGGPDRSGGGRAHESQETGQGAAHAEDVHALEREAGLPPTELDSARTQQLDQIVESMTPEERQQMAQNLAETVSTTTHKGKMKEMPGELFGEGGPRAADVQQGYLGDCYLMAAMAAVAHTRPDILVSHVRENPEGTVTVTFHVDGEPVEVTVDRSVPVSGLFKKSPKYGRNKGDGQWVGTYEKAYAEQFGMGEGYEGIGGGGHASAAMEALTGGKANTEYTSSFDLSDPADRQLLTDMLSNAGSLPTTASISKRPWYKEIFGRKPPSHHAYTILGTHVDEAGRLMVDVRNPHGVGGKYGEDFSMPLEKFADTFYRVQQTDLPPAPGPDGQTRDPIDHHAGYDRMRAEQGYGERVGPIESPDVWQDSAGQPLGYAVPDRAHAEDVARRLAAGDMNATKDLGMRAPKGEHTPITTYGVGQRPDGTYVVVRGKILGSEHGVTFPEGVTPLVEVEPSLFSRSMKSRDEMPVESLSDPATEDREVFLPSHEMVEFVAEHNLDEFTHQTGFEYFGTGEGDGKIVNPTKSDYNSDVLGSGAHGENTVGIKMGRPELYGHDADGSLVYRTPTELRASDGTLIWQTDVYTSKNGSATEPPDLSGPVHEPGDRAATSDGFNAETGRMDNRYRDLASDPAQYEALQRAGAGGEELDSFVTAADDYIAANDHYNEVMDRLFANEGSIDEVTAADHARQQAEEKLATAKGKVDEQVGQMKQTETAARRERLGSRPEEMPPPDNMMLAAAATMSPETIAKLEGTPALDRFREAVAERDRAATEYRQVEWDRNYERAGHEDPRTFNSTLFQDRINRASTRFREASALVKSRADILETHGRRVEARERWVQETEAGGGLDTGRIARDGSEKIGDIYARPDAEVAMKTRGLVDYRVGRVESRYPGAGDLANSDFAFNFARMTSGEPLSRVVERVSKLADAEDGATLRGADRHTFLHELDEQGVSIVIEDPEFSNQYLGRDPRMLAMRQNKSYSVWREGNQIHIRDNMLSGNANTGEIPPNARTMPDLFESEASNRAFLDTVSETLGMDPESVRRRQAERSATGTDEAGANQTNRVIGKPMSREEASAMVRRLSRGDDSALGEMGVRPAEGFEPHAVEWGVVDLGGGKFGVVRGSEHGVMGPDGQPLLEHSHPLHGDRLLENPGTVEDVLGGPQAHLLLPSSGPRGGDLDVMIAHGQDEHVLHLPYVESESGHISNPGDAPGGTPIDLHITRAPERSRAGDLTIYEVHGEYRSGDKVLWPHGAAGEDGTFYVVHTGDGERIVTFDRGEVDQLAAAHREMAAGSEHDVPGLDDPSSLEYRAEEAPGTIRTARDANAFERLMNRLGRGEPLLRDSGPFPRRLDEPIPRGEEKPKFGEDPGKQRRYSVDQYIEMWETEQGRRLTDAEKRQLARGCVGISSLNIWGAEGSPPLNYTYDTFEHAEVVIDNARQWLKEQQENPATADQYKDLNVVMFAKLFWSNQTPDPRNPHVGGAEPDPDAFLPDPDKGGWIDMSGYEYRSQPGYINFDYGYWDETRQSFWHANHSQPGMKVYQSTREKFEAGYLDFDRIVFGVAFARNYDPAKAAALSALRPSGSDGSNGSKPTS